MHQDPHRIHRSSVTGRPSAKAQSLFETISRVNLRENPEPIMGLKCPWCGALRDLYVARISEDSFSRDEIFRVADSNAKVSVSTGFWISQCEVSQQQWQSVRGNNPSFFTVKPAGSKLDDESGPENFIREQRQASLSKLDTRSFPVERVSWHDALDFCTQLTVIERDAGRLSEAHCYSLPSEAQWELACRAGTTTFNEFGDEIKSQQANFDGRFPLNSPEEGPVLARPAPVGAYSPNQWGIYDMHGNVEEWCRNSLDAVCPPDGEERIIRGGSYASSGSLCQSSFRSACIASSRSDSVGFRVVLTECPRSNESSD
jgi:formylglycine-generating enzyme required for sulfatase activity